MQSTLKYDPTSFRATSFLHVLVTYTLDRSSIFLIL